MVTSPAFPIRRAGRPTTGRPRRLFCLPPAGAGASIAAWWEMPANASQLGPETLTGAPGAQR